MPRRQTRILLLSLIDWDLRKLVTVKLNRNITNVTVHKKCYYPLCDGTITENTSSLPFIRRLNCLGITTSKQRSGHSKSDFRTAAVSCYLMFFQTMLQSRRISSISCQERTS